MLRRFWSAAALIAVIAASFFISAPRVTLGDEVQVQKITVSPKDLQLVCTGSLYRSGADSGSSVNDFSQLGVAALNGNFVGPSNAILTVTDLNGQVFGQQPSGQVVDALTLTASGANLVQGSALLNANQLQLVSDSRAAGLLATPCLKAESDFWMLGADTSVGRESLLILNNPGSVNATVSLEVFGTAGKIVTAGQEGISVAAKSSTVVPIASLAPGLPTLALHVQSISSAITATLQQKTVRGLVAAGADWISPSTELSTSLAIPGFFVRGVQDGSKLRTSSADYADISPILRVFAPASDKGNVTVTAQVVGTSASTFGTVVRHTFLAGSVNDVTLTGLQDGDYSVFITSDQPVRAALRLSRSKLGAKPATDFTWLQAASAITHPVSITVPNAGISKLSIANPNRVATNVSLTVNGVAKVVSVPAQNSLTVPIANGSKVTVASVQAVAVNLIVDINFTVANLPLLDYQNVGSKQTILVR